MNVNTYINLYSLIYISLDTVKTYDTWKYLKQICFNFMINVSTLGKFALIVIC